MEEEGHCSLESHVLEDMTKLFATIVDDISKQEDGTFPNLSPFLWEIDLMPRHATG